MRLDKLHLLRAKIAALASTTMTLDKLLARIASRGHSLHNRDGGNAWNVLLDVTMTRRNKLTVKIMPAPQANSLSRWGRPLL